MSISRRWLAPLFAGPILTVCAISAQEKLNPDKAPPSVPATVNTSLEWLVPDTSKMAPFAEQVPIAFVGRGQNAAAWAKLPKFWNTVEETAFDPVAGRNVTRKAVKIKLPLGINVPPTIPTENALTVAKFNLGKALYYDPILSSSNLVSCATCHAPAMGFSDGSRVSTGIAGKKGGMNSPTVINSAWNRFQFWDGRAESLEGQAQGPVGNSSEMFDGSGHAWNNTVTRLRKNDSYNSQFLREFGHAPTQDAIAKAIGTYERLVIVGNAIYDRAEVAMRKRVDDEEGTKFVTSAKDYETVLREAFAAKDTHSLKALNLGPTDAAKIPEVAGSIQRGRDIFFGKARCTQCHVGESFTDHGFHNLGVGVADGKLPQSQLGRFGAQVTGAKDITAMGAFKTPPLRALLQSKPYMHNGMETTLEQVVEFYNRGGNANEFLDPKMRDLEAENAWIAAKAAGKPWEGVEVKVFTHALKPIVPMALKLTVEEQKDLVMYLRALESDPVDATIADATWIAK